MRVSAIQDLREDENEDWEEEEKVRYTPVILQSTYFLLFLLFRTINL